MRANTHTHTHNNDIETRTNKNTNIQNTYVKSYTHIYMSTQYTHSLLPPYLHTYVHKDIDMYTLTQKLTQKCAYKKTKRIQIEHRIDSAAIEKVARRSEKISVKYNK